MSSWEHDQRTFMLYAEQTTRCWNMEQATRYATHLQEESRELMLALALGDYTKAVDGAIDSIVVAIGFLHSLGISCDEAWDAVHAANMRKVDGSLGPIVRRHDDQIGKPEQWFGPEAELAKLVERARTRVCT